MIFQLKALIEAKTNKYTITYKKIIKFCALKASLFQLV